MLDTKFSVRDMAMGALKGVAYLKGLVNSEMYKYDGNNNFSPTTSGSITALTSIAQGDGVAARTGNSLLVKSVYINFNCINNASATNGTIITSWLIMDTQQVGDTSPAFTDIFTATNVNAILSPESVGRFKILRRDNIVLSPNGVATKQFKIYKRMLHHVRFNGVNSTDIQKGGLYWVVCSNQAVNAPTVTYQFRVAYHDN